MCSQAGVVGHRKEGVCFSFGNVGLKLDFGADESSRCEADVGGNGVAHHKDKHFAVVFFAF